jgi:superfamily II DNA/RNA helicase
VDGIELVVHFDPPNDHKDYLHRSGRTARAGATGLVVSLAQRDQVRELQRMHDAAGVDPARHDVGPGHPAVREIATTGAPVPPPPPAAEIRSRPADAPARNRRGARSSGAGGQGWSGGSSGRQGGSQGRPAGSQSRSAGGQNRPAASHSRPGGQSRTAGAARRPADRRG